MVIGKNMVFNKNKVFCGNIFFLWKHVFGEYIILVNTYFLVNTCFWWKHVFVWLDFRRGETSRICYGQQEKVASRPKVLLGFFSNTKFILEVCWIKPFLSGLDQIIIQWARTAGTGPWLYKKQMWSKSVKSETTSSINFLPGFRKSKKFGHWTLGSGGQKAFKRSEQMK